MFTLGADKTRDIINYGIAPYFYEILKANVNLADFYVINFDESINSITQTNQMDCLINLVKVPFWNSSYIGHGTHKDVLKKFEDSLTGLNPSKMIQISMDQYNNFIVIGDLNIDILDNTKDRYNYLSNLCDTFSLNNLIKGKTCFKG